MLKLDPIWHSDNQQKQFRLLLEAISRPGRCYPLLKHSDNGSVALGILAILLDAEVSLADPHHLLQKSDWPMLQAKLAESEQADYLVCDALRNPDFMPRIGTLQSPEQSATIVLVVNKLGKGNVNLKLTGPGIKKSENLIISGLSLQWLSKREDWNCSFPLGVDFILIDDEQVTALPRTTKVELI